MNPSHENEMVQVEMYIKRAQKDMPSNSSLNKHCKVRPK